MLNGWSILRGLFTGVDIDEVQKSSPHRNEEDIEVARKLWHWCQREEVSLLQLAIQFCLRESRIHGNPIGSLNAEQLQANIHAASTPIADEVWHRFVAEFAL